MSMLTNNKQEVADVQNSVVNQAQGDIIIHNGITAETAMEICKCVVRSELAIYTQQANETAHKRLDEISEKTIDRISSLKQDLLQRFNEPAIQIALNETFKSHIAAEPPLPAPPPELPALFSNVLANAAFSILLL